MMTLNDSMKCLQTVHPLPKFQKLEDFDLLIIINYRWINDNPYLPVIKIIVWIAFFSPVQNISVWLLTFVSLISSLRVSGIPGVFIWGNSYTPWALSKSCLVLNWCCVLIEAFAKSLDQKGCSPYASAVQSMIIVDCCGANMYGTGHGSDTRSLGLTL